MIRRSSCRRAITASCSKAGRVPSRRTDACWSSPICRPRPIPRDRAGDGRLDPRRRRGRVCCARFHRGQYFLLMPLPVRSFRPAALKSKFTALAA